MASSDVLLRNLVHSLRQIGKLEPDTRKGKAYFVAADSLVNHADRFVEMVIQPSIKQAFKALPGIGDSISSKIEEFLMTGEIRKLRELEDAKDQ